MQEKKLTKSHKYASIIPQTCFLTLSKRAIWDCLMKNICEVLGRFGKRISVGVFHVWFLFKKKKEKREEKKKKRKIVFKENKIKSLKFQFKGVVGGAKRIVGDLEFL